jgi:hypothetical protein
MRTCRRTLAAVAVSLAAATGMRAQEDAPRPPPPPKAVPAKVKPLSPEDAEIVKQLALLEKVDLLRDLELFEDKKQQDDRSGEKKPPPGGEP